MRRTGHRKYAIPLALCTGALGLQSTPGHAERPLRENVEHRTSLAFHVSQAELQKFVPAPWSVDSFATGSRKGANVLLQFRERWLDLDANGEHVSIPERGLVVLVQAKNSVTGDTGPRVIREYTMNSAEMSGPYHNSVLVKDFSFDRAVMGRGTAPAIATESWKLEDMSGHAAALSFRYARGLTTRVRKTYLVRGDAGIVNMYRTDQGSDVVKDVSSGIDRTSDYSFTIDIAELKSVFDGSETFVCLEVMPWYIREVSKPSSTQ